MAQTCRHGVRSDASMCVECGQEGIAQLMAEAGSGDAEEAALRARAAHVERDFARLNADETALREKLAVAIAALTDIEEQGNDSQHSATTARECLAKLGVE